MVTLICARCGREFRAANIRVGTAKWCSTACAGAGRTVDPALRFWSKVQKTETCWIWMAARDPRGYGRFGTSPSRVGTAHRFAYELVKGKVPEGLHLDHLCRNPSCVNPDHLEPVTARENIVRAGLVALRVCRSGKHQLTDETIGANGAAVTCVLCRREAMRARARRRGVRTKEEYWASMRGKPPQFMNVKRT